MARIAFCALTLAALVGIPATASQQFAISAKAGLIQYVEGAVALDGKAIELTPARFEDWKEKSELRTTDGRVEVLLNPGAFLRLGENSSMRMIMNRLVDTRIEFLSGSAVIEVADDLGERGNQLTVLVGDTTVSLTKNGLYRFDAEPLQLRVYMGEAVVKTAANLVPVKTGRQMALTGGAGVIAEKFDNKSFDALMRWARRRGESVAMANVSAAKYAKSSGMSYSTGWIYNPYFGYYTFLPGAGMFRSPWGWNYYSPNTVNRFYDRVYNNSAGGLAHTPISNASSYGYSTMQSTSSGYSGTIAASGTSASRSVSSPSTAAPAATAAPVARESGSAGGRGR